MQNDVRQAFLGIAKTQESLLTNGAALKGALLDECLGEHKSEIRALAMIVEIDFLSRLQTEQSLNRSWGECGNALAQNFAQESGLRGDLAEWVVETWWSALTLVKVGKRVGGVSPPRTVQIAQVQPAPSSAPAASPRVFPWRLLTVIGLGSLPLIGIFLYVRSAETKRSDPEAKEMAIPTSLTSVAPPLSNQAKPTAETQTMNVGKQPMNFPDTRKNNPTKSNPSADVVPTAGVTKPEEPIKILNSMGERLIWIESGTWLAATPVRKRDYAEFASRTNAPSGKTIVSVNAEGWQEIAGSWKQPGFEQSDDDPVIGISWNEAKEFCRWLTQTESETGKIAAAQRYRLPTEAEWSKMITKSHGLFAWGNQWPPPALAGNFAGQEITSSGKVWPEEWPVIDGFIDGFPRTAPVGKFTTSGTEFSDVAGNVLQWCDDAFAAGSPNRVARGSSWATSQSSQALLGARQGNPPDFRATILGFRIILVTDSDTKN